MKKVVFIGIIIIVIILAKVFFFSSKNESQNPPLQNQNLAQPMTISSPSFNNSAKIPPKFTCDGGNINPELIIQNVPPQTKSLALIMDDPDAVGGKTFTHWLVWNIDPKTEKIKQESVPPGATEGLNDRQKVGYTGPCPPDGKPHRYFFKLYALDSMIDLQPSAAKKELEAATLNHLIKKAEFRGMFSFTLPTILQVIYENLPPDQIRNQNTE